MKQFLISASDFTTITQDASAANLALGKSYLNMIIKRVMSMRDFMCNKSYFTRTSVASQQAYEVTPNTGKIEWVKATLSNVNYILKEKKDETEWQKMNYHAVSGNVLSNWHLNPYTRKIEFYPIPTSTDVTLTVYYAKRIKDLGTRPMRQEH